MEEFNFLKTIYVYRLSIEEDKIKTSAITKLLKTQEEIDKFIKENSSQSTIFTDDYLFIKRCSFIPDDEKLVDEMKMELLTMYSKYIDHLSNELEDRKKIRLNLFKHELRILKLEKFGSDNETDL